MNLRPRLKTRRVACGILAALTATAAVAQEKVDTLLTNGKITTDNVDDDNGTRITDGAPGTTALFPYLGRPNNPPAGPNP